MNNPKIKLRKIRKSDVKYFLKWWLNKDVIKLTSGIREESKAVLCGYFEKMIKSKSDIHFLILLNNKPIGHLSLIRKNKTTCDLNIIIGDKKYWGKGFGALAIKKGLKIIFEKLRYKKVCLEVRPNNIRAIRAYEKCGFKKVGIKKYPKNKYLPVVFKMKLGN